MWCSQSEEILVYNYSLIFLRLYCLQEYLEKNERQEEEEGREEDEDNEGERGWEVWRKGGNSQCSTENRYMGQSL